MKKVCSSGKYLSDRKSIISKLLINVYSDKQQTEHKYGSQQLKNNKTKVKYFKRRNESKSNRYEQQRMSKLFEQQLIRKRNKPQQDIQINSKKKENSEPDEKKSKIKLEPILNSQYNHINRSFENSPISIRSKATQNSQKKYSNQLTYLQQNQIQQQFYRQVRIIQQFKQLSKMVQ